jgi:hypothetical protein
MSDAADRPLDTETIRRFASEQVRITLGNDEVAAIKALLDGLLAEIRLVAPSDRGSTEPEIGVILEEWSS